jgi:hypothetical protein
VESGCDAMSSTVDSKKPFRKLALGLYPVGSILRTGIHAEMLMQFLAFAFGEPFVISSQIQR